ncbi:MAG: hypothetical protein M1337_08820 [Actinobacteria bacterium]|nr:hypothetical protein [Actinomycetota bacterium]
MDRDPALVAAKLPACTEEEIEGWVWDVSNGRKRVEEPVKMDDHGMDCVRYVVAHRDVVIERRARGGAATVGIGGIAASLTLRWWEHWLQPQSNTELTRVARPATWRRPPRCQFT